MKKHLPLILAAAILALIGKYAFPSTINGATTISGHVTLEGVTSTGATGSGKLVFDGSPTFITPILGTPASGNLSSTTNYPGVYAIPAITAITTGNWSTLGSGGTRTNTTGPSGGGAINIVGTTGGTGNIYGVSRTVAGGDFSYDLIVEWQIPINFGVDVNVQAGFTDGTKVEGCGPANSANATTSTQAIGNGVSTTTLSGGTYAGNTGGNFTNGSAGIAPNPILFRLARVGTALTCAVSWDGGVTYITMFSNAFLTASSIQVSSDPRAATKASSLTLISSTLP